MAEPTLSEVFGSGASQDLNNLTISKTDLVGKGLTAAASNRAEALLVAVILKSADVLTETARASDLVNRNVTVAYIGQDLIDQGGGNIFRRDTFTVSLYKTTTFATVDPDDY